MEDKDSMTIRRAVINKAISFIFDNLEEEITVEEFDSVLVVYERKKGNYHNLPEEWCTFMKKYEYLSSANRIYMESTIDDPTITDENRCMYELCQTISPDHPALKEDSYPYL